VTDASLTVLDQIRSRGYWEVTIRPTSFQKDRITSVVDLEPLLESAQVRISGWYFPHLDNQPATIKGDHIEELVETDTILEFFRFCQSGQFFHLAAFREDWPERAGMFDSFPANAKPRELLRIGSVIWRFTHVYDFAARMAQKLPGSDDLFVEVIAHKIDGRRLESSPGRMPLFEEYRAAVSDFSDARQLSRAILMAEQRKLAVEAAEKVLVQFQWRRVTKQMIASWQDEMYGAPK
jgi:hypothetical protein